MPGADGADRFGRQVAAAVDAGRDGVRREHVAEIQRARILRAMLEVCAEQGVSNVTVAPIVERAGVSRRTFYDLFDDVEDCFIATLEDAHERLGARVMPAWRQSGRWRERIRHALVELLAFLDNDPLTGRLVIVEALAAGPRALERRNSMLAHAVAAVEEGRSEATQSHDPPSVTGEGIVGAVASVIYGRMPPAHAEPLLFLTGPLMSVIVLPYLGLAAAKRELAQPTPEPPPRSDFAPSDAEPLTDLGIRVTYRTLRVLGAIAAQPGASNRMVGKAAGIEDQGQVSKLLTRLENVGLIHNSNAHSPARGMANAWRLTERGERVTRSLRVQAAFETSLSPRSATNL